MEKWNILATAQTRRERYLLRLLNKYGEFGGLGYRDVILGYVADVSAFLEALESIRREAPGKLRSLGQIVPLERNFRFDVADFRDKAKETVSCYIDQLEDSRFFVRVVRRGHKGEISGMEMEKELDGFILEFLENKGKHATISIEKFENIIIVETIEDRAGVALITKDVKEKYPSFKVK